MDTAGITSFKLGRAESEFPLVHNVAKTDVYHASVGMRGSISDRWKYDAAYIFGQTDQFMANTGLSVNRNAFAAADAVLFATPEYNRSVPGVLKNALDIGSRPYGKSVWSGKPAAVISVSPGALAGFGANHHLR